jgi:hypothetical protein
VNAADHTLPASGHVRARITAAPPAVRRSPTMSRMVRLTPRFVLFIIGLPYSMR